MVRFLEQKCVIRDVVVDLPKVYKKKRWKHRISSGFLFAELKKKKAYEMTLTTSDRARYNDLHRDADVLIKRIRRRNKGLQYLMIRADEGNGVLHIVFTGANLYKPIIKKMWYDIHSSYIVEISRVRSQKKITNYLLTHYLTGHAEKCNFSRLSYSKGWMPKGALERWKQICIQAKKRFHYNSCQRQHYYKREPVSYMDVYLYKKRLWERFLYLNSFKQLALPIDV